MVANIRSAEKGIMHGKRTRAAQVLLSWGRIQELYSSNNAWNSLYREELFIMTASGLYRLFIYLHKMGDNNHETKNWLGAAMIKHWWW